MLENETNPIIFSCQATGEPVPSISWYFNGVMINESKYNVSNTLRETTVTSLLTITNANSFDVGTYTCQAENIIGIDQSSGVLTVNGKHCCDPNCDYIHTYAHTLSSTWCSSFIKFYPLSGWRQSCMKLNFLPGAIPIQFFRRLPSM